MNQVQWKLLLIEDDPEDAMLTRLMLANSNYARCEVQWVETYEDGWLALQAGGFDAVILDFQLGKHKGTELIERAVAAGVTAPMILYTSHGSYEVDLEAMRSGAALYLTKGETSAPLLERGIRYAIERKQGEIALAEAHAQLQLQKQDLEQANQRLEQTLAAQSESEQRFRSLFESMSEGFALHEIITDANGLPCDYLYLEINPAFERLTGLKRENVVGRTLRQILPDEDPYWIKVYGQVALSGEPAHAARYSNTLQRYYEVYAYSPAPRRFAVVFVEATERKQMEAQLRANLEKYAALFESVPVGLTLGDPQGAILESNKEGERLLGLSPEEHAARQIDGSEWNLIRPDGSPMPPEEFPSVRALREKRRVDDVMMGVVSGSAVPPTWINVTAVPLDLEGYGVLVAYNDITARKLEEDARSLLLEQHRLIFENLYEGLLVTDGEGKILLTNQPIGRFIGLDTPPPSNIEGYSALLQVRDAAGEVITPEQWPLSRALRGEAVRDFEMHLSYAAQDGEYVALINARPVFDEQGQVIMAVLTGREITERKRIEEDLLKRTHELSTTRRQTEIEKGRLQAVMEALPVGVVIMDELGRILLTNQTYEKLWRVSLSPEDDPLDHKQQKAWWAETGQPLQPDDWASVQCLRTGKTVTGQFLEIERFDGSHIFVLNSASPIFNASGRVIGSAAAILDITPLRKVEEELRRRETELRLIMDAEPALISYIDSRFCYRRVNKSYERWFGVTAAETEGRHVSQVLGQAAWEAVRPYMEAALRGELVVYERELPYQGGGPRWVQVTYTPHIEGDQVPGFFVHVVDIGERVRAEKELSEYAEQLSRSNRELEEFAYIVSHDLKEPLRKVERFGEQIHNRIGANLGEVELDYLERMISASVRMRRIIDDLLALSRVISAGKPFSVVDLNEIMERALDDLDVKIQHSGAVVEYGELPEVWADPTQMELLFQNLISNAIKFQPPNQKPVVRITHQTISPHMVEFCFKDNGIGFEMKYAERLFLPFQRLHGRTEYEGSGIGLAICRRIVERHSGMISVQSEPNQGTSFFVRLPRKPLISPAPEP